MSRSQVITDGERSLLVYLIVERKQIIFNKNADGKIVKAKGRAWQEITHRLNAAALGSTRTVKQVRKIWENMKGRAKKMETERKRELCHTVGGCPPYEPEGFDDLTTRILALIREDCDGSEFDNEPLEQLINDEGDEGSLETVPLLPSMEEADDDLLDPRPSTSLSAVSSPTTPAISSVSRPLPTLSEHPRKRRRKYEAPLDTYKQVADLQKIEHDIIMAVHRKKIELLEAQLKVVYREEEGKEKRRAAELKKIESEDRACKEVKEAKLKQVQAELEMKTEVFKLMKSTLEDVRVSAMAFTIYKEKNIKEDKRATEHRKLESEETTCKEVKEAKLKQIQEELKMKTEVFELMKSTLENVRVAAVTFTEVAGCCNKSS